jgi:hypothetical protein
MIGANDGFSAFVAGVFALGFVIGARVWMAAIRRSRDRRWAALTDRCASDYPRLVESWGGSHILHGPEAVAAGTRLLDPSAAAGTSGIFRRLLGG